MGQKMQLEWLPPPNYLLQEHITHGLSSQPSFAQVAAYIVIALSLSVYLSCTISLYFNTVLLILYLILFVTMFITSAMATLCDPTDRMVYYYKWSRHDKKISFNPDYSQVLFCQHCDSYCMSESKHCRACNRCVNKFDHHCMWFNSCVGQLNYRYFVVSIASTFAYAVVVIVHVVMSSFYVDFRNSTQLTKIILSWIVAGFLAVFGFLLLNLIALHIYLNATGQSTYQFLQRKKRQEQQERLEKQKIDASRVSLQILPEKFRHRVHVINSEEQLTTSKKNIRKQNIDTRVVKVAKVGHHEPQISSNVIFEKADSRENLQQEKPLHEEREAQKEEQKKSGKLQRHGDNDITFVRENQTDEQLRSDKSVSIQKLPQFLRQNRSLKMLLAHNQISSPSRKRLQTIL